MNMFFDCCVLKTYLSKKKIKIENYHKIIIILPTLLIYYLSNFEKLTKLFKTE